MGHENPFLPKEDKVDMSAYLQEAPVDDGVYARSNGSWVKLDLGYTGNEAWQSAFNASLDWSNFGVKYRKLGSGDYMHVYISSAVPLAAIEPGETLYFGTLPEGYRPVIEQEVMVPAMTTEGELDFVTCEFKSNGAIQFTAHGKVKNLTVSAMIMLT